MPGWRGWLALIPTFIALGGAPGLAAQSSSGTVLVPAADGNEARFRVREQLARLSFPSDAVGTTRAITGRITLRPDGAIDPAASRFEVDLTTLATDQPRRDNYIRRNTLETATFPAIIFVPKTASGLPSTLPDSGRVTFQLTGDLTLHGVTRPATWMVAAEFSDTAVAGIASTRFTFGEYGMERPRVSLVLSVEDDIRLEYEFRLVRKSDG